MRIDLPHIPDEPSDADLSRILEYLERAVLYFELGKLFSPSNSYRTVRDLVPIFGFERDLVPIFGIGWLSDHETAVVYIDGKPYVFSYSWIGGYSAYLADFNAPF